MSAPAKAMLFAAGKGTRMRHLTADAPKSLINVAGRPLLDHALDIVIGAGCTDIVVNTHYRAEQLRTHLAAESRARVRISHEDVLLETGGGLKQAAALLGREPVLTLNADAVWRGGNPASVLAEAEVPAGGACLLLVPKQRAVGHLGQGDFFISPDGQLTRRGEAPEAPYIYTGLQLIDPRPVYDHPADVFSLNVVWDRMISEGVLRGAVYSGDWCDVGQPESLDLAERLLAHV